jgi:hypothetical protein
VGPSTFPPIPRYCTQTARLFSGKDAVDTARSVGHLPARCEDHQRQISVIISVAPQPARSHRPCMRWTISTCATRENGGKLVRPMLVFGDPRPPARFTTNDGPTKALLQGAKIAKRSTTRASLVVNETSRGFDCIIIGAA